MILAGDVGGTKCNLALFQLEEGRVSPRLERTFSSRDFEGLESVVLKFLEEEQVGRHRGEIRGACLGIAGPVVAGRVETPNLPWIVTRDALVRALELEAVELINDLEATGYGIETLKRDQLLTLNEGKERPRSNRALIAAGTGLGEAFLIWQDGRFRPVPSEGGHTDFGPRDSLEIELLQYLLKRWNRISYERVLSGPGLFNIYSFLKDSGRGQEPEWLAERIERGEDPSAAISEAALRQECQLCVQALDLFVKIYGAEAGNLALTVMAVGGVYLGGGIAPKITDKLVDGSFLESFCRKGRLSGLMKQIPVHVILNPKTALYGAARCGFLSLGAAS